MKKIIRFLRSMQFGMILLALVIACSVAGSLIVQQREPMEYVNRYGEDAARLILALKLNDVFSSVYFLVMMAALCLYLCFFMVPTAVALTEEGYAIVSPKPPPDCSSV